MLALLRFFLAGLCLALAVVLLSPEQAPAFVGLGPALGLSQRHFRVFDNFVDPAANNNTEEHPNFPGRVGASLAIWKAAVEWGSGAHGDGSGDPTQPTLGSGAANFDPSFQGSAQGPGDENDNIHSATTAFSLGLLAFTENDNSGWRIRYYEDWTWSDGPGATGPGEYDLQSVATHEYGHAIGLGHSSVSGATMEAAGYAESLEQRSLEPDDIAGLQSLYGSVLPTKPVILAVDLSSDERDVIITGTSFHATDNSVRFTDSSLDGLGPGPEVSGVLSTLGGTQITVAIPTGAGPGDVLVRSGGLGHANLSNAYPFNAPGPKAGSPTITSVTPPQLPSLTAGPQTTALITGSALDLITDVRLDGVSLPGLPVSWTILSPTEIEFQIPVQNSLGTVALEVSGPLGSDSVDIEIVPPSSPVLRIGNGNEPEEVFSFIATPLRMGAKPGSLVFLGTSLSNVPLSAPPLLELGIGGTSAAHLLGVAPVGPVGWTQVNFSFQLQFGTVLYWQIVEFDASNPGSPLPASNVPSTFFVF